MDLTDASVIQATHAAWLNARRILNRLRQDNAAIEVYLDGFDLMHRASADERILCRGVAVQVWTTYINELRAKLMLLGFDMTNEDPKP